MAELERRTAQSGLAEKASRRSRPDMRRSDRSDPMDQLAPAERYSPYRFFSAEEWASFAPIRR